MNGGRWVLGVLLAAVALTAFPGTASAACPGTKSWNTDSSGTWATAGNWTPAGVPTNTDEVCIDRGTQNPTITISADAIASSVTSTEKLVLTTGIFQPAAGAAGSVISGDFDLTGGTLRVNNAMTVSGTTTWSGSALDGGAALTNTGTLAITASVSASTPITNSATIRQDGAGTLTLNQALTNNGLYAFNGEGDIAGGATLFNDGMVRKTTADPDVDTSVISAPINAVGTDFDVQAGTLQIAGSSTALAGGGALTTAPGTMLRFQRAGGTQLSVGGTITGSGGGTVRIEDGQTTAITGTATLDVDNLEAAGGAFFGGGGTLVNEGTMHFSGARMFNLFVNGAGGTVHQTADIVFNGGVTNNGLWNIDGDSDISRDANGGFTNNATVRKSAGSDESTLIDLNWTGNGQTIDVQAGTLRYGSGGTWNGTTTVTAAQDTTLRLSHPTSGWTLDIDGTLTGSGQGVVSHENGDIRAADDVTDAIISFPGTMYRLNGGSLYGGPGDMTNTGVVNVTGGSSMHNRFINGSAGTVKLTANLSFDGDVANNGLWDIAADIAMTRSGNGGFTNNNTVRKSAGSGEATVIDLNWTGNGQTIDVQAGTLRYGGSGTWNGTTTVTAAQDTTLRLSHPSAGWTLGIDGTLTGSGQGVVSHENGDILAVDDVTDATINFPGTMYRLNGGNLYGGPGDMTNTGVVNVTGASAMHNRFVNGAAGTVKLTANLSFDGGVTNNGLWDIAGDIAITRSGNGGFTNNATVRKSAGSGEATAIDLNWTGNGQTIDVQAGTLRYGGSGTWNGTTTVTAAQNTTLRLSHPSAGWTLSVDGTLTGSGQGIVSHENGDILALDDVTDATINFPGTMYRLNGGQLYGGPGDMTNTGVVNVTGASAMHNRFVNGAAGTVKLTANLSFDGGVTNNGLWDIAGDIAMTRPGNGGFTNNATVRKSAGNGEATLIDLNWTGNGQTIDVQAGTLRYGGSGTWNGTTTVTAAQNTTLRLSHPTSGWTLSVDGTVNGSGEGVVSHENGDLLAVDDTDDATINFPGTMYRLNGGNLYGGPGDMRNTGVVNVTGASAMHNKFVNEAAGIVRQTASLNFDGGLINNGLWDLAGDVGISRTANGGFTNNGTLRKSAGTGISTILDANWNGTDQTFDVDTGTLRWSSSGTWAGTTTITPAQDATFQFFKANDCCWFVTLDGTLTGSGAGTVSHETGDLRAGNGATLDFPSGMFHHSGGSLYALSGNLTNINSVTLDGGHVSSFFVNGAAGTVVQNAAISANSNFTNAGLWEMRGDTSIISTGNNQFLNTGTLRKTAGSGTATVTVNLSNTGTVESRAGRISMSSVTQMSGATLTGGTWLASGTGELSFTGGFGISTNNATIVLSGSDAAIPELQGLTSNTGSLTLANGNSIQLPGNLTNSGSLSLGRSSTLAVAGSFTQTGPGTLTTVIDGRPSTGRFGRIQAGGLATLGGTLAVETDDNFTAVEDDLFPLLEFGSQTGNFASVTGLTISPAVAFSPLLNPTDYTLRVAPSGSTRVNLRATDVTVTPAGTLEPGQAVSVGFTVSNHGDGSTAGAWTDSVYLSADANYDPTDRLIGRVTHTGDLPHGSEYDVTLDAPLPGALPGTYRVVVVPDSRGANPAINRGSGFGASAERDVDIDVLTPGTPVNDSIASGQRRYYQVPVGAGLDLVLTGAFGAAAKASLFARDGRLPDPTLFDATSFDAADADLFVPGDGPARTVYVLVEGLAGAGAAQAYTLSAEAIDFGIRRATPTRSGNTGPVTLTVDGSGFSDATEAELTGVGSPIAGSVTVKNSHRLYATFDLTGAPAGSYALHLTDGADDATKAGALEVTAGGGGGSLVLTTEAPPAFRVGWPNQYTIRYRNDGDSDVGAPLIRVSADAADVRIPGHGDFADEVGFLARVHDGPHGVIPPREGGTQRVLFLDHDVAAHQIVHFKTDELRPGDTTPLDWSGQKASLKPPGMSDASWDTIYPTFTAAAGASTGAYVRALHGAAAEAATHDADLVTEAELLIYMRDRAVVTAPGASVRGTLTHAGKPRPDTELALSDGSGDAYVTRSWADGSYAFWDVPPGTYQLTAPALGPEPLLTVTVPPGGSVDLDSPEGSRIEGSVFTQDGQAVEGAIVQAYDPDARRSYTETTNEEGFFAIDPVAPATYEVSLDPPAGHAPPAPQTATVDTATGASLTFTLAEGGALQGVVTGPGDAPVQGATVVATPEDGGRAGTVHAVTDAAGNYHFDGLKPGTYHLLATKAGLGAVERDATVVDGTSETADMAMSTTGNIEGTVTDVASGLPIAGASVSTDAPSDGAPATTAADGTFTRGDLAPGTFSIWVRAPGYLPKRLPITLAAGQTLDVPVALSEANRITGLVRGAGQVPVPGQAVALYMDDIAVGAVTTDSSGAFDFGPLDDGDYIFALGTGADFSINRQELSLSSDKPNIIAESPRKVVMGNVFDAGGAPAAGAGVQLIANGDLIDVTETDDDGGYRFVVTATGDYEVRASKLGYGFSAPLDVSVASLDATVAVANPVRGGGTLEVTVTDQSAALVEDALVAASPTDDNPLGATVTGIAANNGVAVLSGLPAGSYAITAQKDGMDIPAGTATVVGTNGTGALQLHPEARIEGTVTGPGGPVAGAAVLAVDRSTGRVFTKSTAANGTYSIPGLPAAGYDVAVAHVDHRLSVTQGVTTTVGQPTALNPALVTTGTAVELTVESAEGQPVGTAAAVLERRNDQSEYRAVAVVGPSDPLTGLLALGRLAPSGDYRLTLRSRGRAEAVYTFTTDGAGDPVGLPLDPATGAQLALPGSATEVSSGTPPRSAAASAPARSRAADPPADPATEWSWFDFLDPTGLKPPERLGIDTTAFKFEWVQYASLPCPPSSADLARARDLSDLIDKAFESWRASARAAKDINISVVQAYLATSAEIALKIHMMAGTLAGTGPTGLKAFGAGAFDTIASTVASVNQQLAEGHGPFGHDLSAGIDAMLNVIDLQLPALEYGAGGGGGAGGIKVASGALQALQLFKQLTVDLDELRNRLDEDVAKGLNDFLEKGDLYRKTLLKYKAALDRLRAYQSGPCPPPDDPPPPPPAPPTNPHNEPNIEGLRPNDPNDIYGLAGVGANHYLTPGQQLIYTGHFENKADADLPARTVSVSLDLDPNVDASTVELGPYGFGDHVVAVPPGRKTFDTRVDDTAVSGLLVDVTARVDTATRKITWTFASIDPATGDEPADGTLGFLAQNVDTPEGVGFFSYSVDPRADLSTTASTLVSAQARIVFDTNAPIDTNVYVNGYDPVAPTATVAALPATTTSPDVPISWAGSDDPNGSGIATYDVLVSTDGGPFVALKTQTTDTSMTFKGAVGHTYGFIAVATDLVGNVQPTPAAPQAATVILPGQTTTPPGPRRFRPDLLIGGKKGKLVGNGVYDAKGRAQTLTVKSKRKKKVRLRIQVQNDGAAADTLTLRGPAGKAKLKLAYKAGKKNVTKKVKAGKHVLRNLKPGAKKTLNVVLSVGAKARKGKTVTLLMSLRSAGDKTAVDAVKLRVKLAKK